MLLLFLVKPWNMSNYRKIIDVRMKSSPTLFKSSNWNKDSNFTWRSITLEHFQRQIMNFDWNINLKTDNCPILAVAHATSLNKAAKVVVSGFATLSTIDEGFYGKGMYFSSSAIYTLPYCVTVSDPCIIICFLLPGNPYPVIEDHRKENSLIGSHIISGYQSHYVMTRINGLPFGEENNLELRKFNEIVIDQESQVVPIFLVELDPYNFKELMVYHQRDPIPIITKNEFSDESETQIIQSYQELDESIWNGDSPNRPIN